MEKADRKTMLVHFDTWLTMTATMSDEQVGKLLRAAIAYARGGSESDAFFGGDKVLALAFSMLFQSTRPCGAWPFMFLWYVFQRINWGEMRKFRITLAKI